MPASLGLSIDREVRLAATPDRVFSFWLDPNLLVRWMGDRAEIDARPGGRWRLEYGDRYVASGEIVEIDRPHRLVLTWGWERGDEGSIPVGASRVEVTFEPDGDGTRMRLRHSDLPDAERPGHAEGWDYFLPRLAAAAAGATSGPADPGAGMGTTAGAGTTGAPGPSAAAAPRAVADTEAGLLLATVELTATPDRVFHALVSEEVTAWWMRPGVFDTREWEADVRVGGAWRASGMGGGRPYTLEGEFREVESGRRLVHTWRVAVAPAGETLVTYVLEPIASGTRLTLRQSGFRSRDQLIATAVGWETSFERLAAMFEAPAQAG